MKRKLIFTIILAIAGVLLIHIGWIVVDGLTDEKQSAQTGVVLGNKVNEDGTPSDRLKARLDRAVELYNDNLIEKIIVSGGTGKEGYDEAVVMGEYLRSQEIPAEHIIKDRNGYNTRMTAENAAKIIEENNLNDDEIYIISQFYHISRTKLAFQQEGFEKVYGAHPAYWEWRDIYSTLREVPAFYKYLSEGIFSPG
ncbi:YdcF family protein [Gracilibacillus oryzae]|uniref:YdcF family protein n=1 Tax=Gracilibacillus oryzae TaxID=1672701 RepID=A0A7C8KX00_9BACI|nr:YdcF family protein [Gracilibacillus oryzae]KAB8139330.1 YdcF family protein [Gracilibacillus oryzae]